MTTFEDTLAAVRPYLRRTLVGDTALAQLAELAAYLPRGTSSYYFERRLNHDSDQVDLLACVTAPDARVTNLAETFANPGPRRDEVRETIGAFCANWCDARTALFDAIPQIWLSYDLDRPVCSALRPNLLVCIDPGYLKRRGAPATGPERPRNHAIVPELLKVIPDDLIAGASREALQMCIASLPAGGEALHVSFMLSRKPRYCKVNLRIERSELRPYLERIGWMGSAAEVDAMLSSFLRDETHIKFQLAVGGWLASRIEYELHFEQSNRLEHNPGLGNFLSQARRANLCSAEEACALRDWPGGFVTRTSADSWARRRRKWLDLKLVCDPAQPPALKAYLGVMPLRSLF